MTDNDDNRFRSFEQQRKLHEGDSRERSCSQHVPLAHEPDISRVAEPRVQPPFMRPALDMQLGYDASMYGFSAVERNEDGTWRRIDPLSIMPEPQKVALTTLRRLRDETAGMIVARMLNNFTFVLRFRQGIKHWADVETRDDE